MDRRKFFAATCLPAVFLAPLWMTSAGAASGPRILVYKTESCGCCLDWVKHLEANGFGVDVRNVADTAVHREKLGMPKQYGSCHTGVVSGYVLEGHVPAAEIKRLLAEKPKARGLAVPGMPMGSPGMEGHRKDRYDVLLVATNGRASVYQHYNGN